MVARAEEMGKRGLKVLTQKVDVAVEESVKTALDAVFTAQGRLDVLVNCAGIVGELL